MATAEATPTTTTSRAGGGQIQCVVVTPERTVLDEAVAFVAVPAYDGEVGFLPGHTPVIARLGHGALRIRDAGGAAGDDGQLVGRGQRQLVVQADGLEDGDELVVAVVAQVADPQEQVDLRRHPDADRRAGQRADHRETPAMAR